MTPQEHWRSLVLLGRFSQGNPADPPPEFLAGVEFSQQVVLGLTVRLAAINEEASGRTAVSYEYDPTPTAEERLAIIEELSRITEHMKKGKAMSTPQTDLITYAETALLLAGEATPGPWATDWNRIRNDNCETVCEVTDPHWQIEGSEWLKTRDFIANARTSVPVLAQAVLDFTEKLEAVRAGMEALTSDWQRQYGRFSESMGSDNPRLQAIDKRIADLDNLRLRITQTQPKEGE